MSRRPPLVTLRLTSPPMRGDLVREVQHRFRGHGLEQDGVYGCRTAARVADWQWRVGARNHAGAIVPEELLVLLGYRKRPGEWVSRARERAGRRNPRAVTCAPPAPALEIIPRSRWCDFLPRGVSAAPHPPGVPHVVHWVGPGRAAEGRQAGIEQVLGFARYHRFTLGWADLAYNFAILRDGAVLEGRGDNVRGAHSGHNTANGYPGVLVVCGTETPAPNERQLEVLQELRRTKQWGRRTGHIEWVSTACPGPVLMPWIRSHR